MKRQVAALFVALALCSSAHAACKLGIKLVHDNADEQATLDQLNRVLATHDTSKWQFTCKLRIEAKVIPHSHPVLTLNTRHLGEDDLLLSTYVHENLHWFLSKHPAQTRAATAELRALYPHLPIGFPEGSSDQAGNYEHLLIIWLEYMADRALLGDAAALTVMEHWSHDHYTKLYTIVLNDEAQIGDIVRKHRLLP